MLLDLFKNIAKEPGEDELAAMGAGLEEDKDKENLIDGKEER